MQFVRLTFLSSFSNVLGRSPAVPTPLSAVRSNTSTNCTLQPKVEVVHWLLGRCLDRPSEYTGGFDCFAPFSSPDRHWNACALHADSEKPLPPIRTSDFRALGFRTPDSHIPVFIPGSKHHLHVISHTYLKWRQLIKAEYWYQWYVALICVRLLLSAMPKSKFKNIMISWYRPPAWVYCSTTICCWIFIQFPTPRNCVRVCRKS